MPPKNAIHNLRVSGSENKPGDLDDTLRSAIDSMGEGFALFGADDRLIFCNEAYLSFHPLGKEFIQPGVLFEDIIRETVKRGYVADAAGNEEAHIKNRLEKHLNPKGPIYRRMADGSSFIISESRTPDGCTLVTTTNVTELREIEEELRESEQRLKTIIDAVPTIITVKDKNFRYIYSNKYHREFFGLDEKEIVGKKHKAISPEHAKKSRKLEETIFNTGETLPHYDYPIENAKGELRHLMVTKAPLLGTSNEITGIITTCIDITERIKSEDALRESEERLKDITDAALDYFWELGPDYRFTFVSERFFHNSEISPELMIGKTRHEFAGPEAVRENPELWAAHQDDLDNRRPFRNFEYSRPFGDGRRSYFSISGKPFFDKGGVFLGYRGASTDITEYRRTERELTHHKKMESLGYLAGGMAHNLNNMLLPIVILGEMTKENLPEGSPDHRNLEIICRAAANAKELVKRISGFSRQQGMAMKSADIYEIIRDGLALIVSIVPSRITLKQDLDKDTGTVFLDAAQTHTVLINLIANAVDAMEGKKGEVTVTLCKALIEAAGKNFVPGLAGGAYAKLTVTDTGRGMDEETLNKIFDPFFTTKSVAKGTGLGLSTAFGTIHKHGGTIRAHSALGKGATFDIFLPLLEKD